MARSLIFLKSPQEATTWCIEQRSNSKTIGYVPTMGALHAGHESLIKKALVKNDVACVSIFVNPLQFNDPQDIKNYPGNFEEDLEILKNIGCDMVYTGTLQQLFPEIDITKQTPPLVKPDNYILGLEDDHRPGHLAGVATIVTRLFEIMGDCQSYFGEKDFQQCLVVKNIAKQLNEKNILIDVVICPTIREPSGLALSSRNTLLDENQKRIATMIYRTLKQGKVAWKKGIENPDKIQQIMRKALQHPDIDIDYVAVRDANHWTNEIPTQLIKKPRGLIAANITGVRLIDNMCFIK